MEYGKGQEVVQKRNGKSIIRKWESWTKSRNESFMEEISKMDTLADNDGNGMLFSGNKRLAIIDCEPKFKH